MIILDKTQNKDWDDYEVKPQDTPPDVKAKQFDHPWEFKKVDGTIITGTKEDYLVLAAGEKVKVPAATFEKAYQLKEV